MKVGTVLATVVGAAVLVAWLADRGARADASARAPWTATAARAQPLQFDAPLAGQALYYHGYRCTVDCSGHDAGYRWAEENDIDDPDDCGGNSQSFIEGCQAYAQEQQESSGTSDRKGDDEDSGGDEDENEENEE